jgi:hypothetical protein
VLEEERQRRELEQYIRLEEQRKPSCPGIKGAGKGKKSRGTGFIYEDKRVAELTPEQIEQRRRARENDIRRAEERRAMREARHAAEEWNRAVGHFKKQVRQIEEDFDALTTFLAAAVVLANARRRCARGIRDFRHSYGENPTGHETEQALYESVAVTLSNLEETGELAEQFEAAVQSYEPVAALLYRLSGRQPSWWYEQPSCLILTTEEVRRFRLTIEFLGIQTISLSDGRKLRHSIAVPLWLQDAVTKIRAGENRIGGTFDWDTTHEKEKAA